MTPNKVYCGDSVQLMSSWPAESVHLAFADPPYNIGYVYDKYEDDLPDTQFVAWCRAWMGGIQRLLTRDGSFYLAIGDEFAADLRIVGRELGFTLRNWIIWHYSFGQHMKAKFGRSHIHIFYFTKNAKQFVFNSDNLRYPSARHTEYQDLRADPRGRVLNDVWMDIPRVCGTFKERAGFHGCQLPEALLTRIILASSRPDDIVFDPFLGTGTTAVAAKRLGRRYVGIDLSPDYAKRSEGRLVRVKSELGDTATGKEWPTLHRELLCQLYRETNVALDNLLPNAVAMQVVTAALNNRAQAKYEVVDVRAELERNRTDLPKLPNDRVFAARRHVTETGKRYIRTTMRLRGRKTSAPGSDQAACAAD